MAAETSSSVPSSPLPISLVGWFKTHIEAQLSATTPWSTETSVTNNYFLTNIIGTMDSGISHFYRLQLY